MSLRSNPERERKPFWHKPGLMGLIGLVGLLAVHYVGVRERKILEHNIGIRLENTLDDPESPIKKAFQTLEAEAYKERRAIEAKHKLDYGRLEKLARHGGGEFGVVRDEFLSRVPEAMEAYKTRESSVPGSEEYNNANFDLAVQIRNHVFTTSVNSPAMPPDPKERAQDAASYYIDFVEERFDYACQGLAILTNILCNAVDIPVRQVGMLNRTDPPFGGHGTTEVKIGENWIALDSTFNESYRKKNGEYLGYAEIRQRLIDGRPVITTTNGHGYTTTTGQKGASLKEYYRSLIGTSAARNHERDTIDPETGKIIPHIYTDPSQVEEMIRDYMKFLIICKPATWDMNPVEGTESTIMYQPLELYPETWDGYINMGETAYSLALNNPAWEEFLPSQNTN